MMATFDSLPREIRKSFAELYGTTDDAKLSEILGIDLKTIRECADERALAKAKQWRKKKGLRTEMPRWEAEDVYALIHHYPTTPNIELAHGLERSVKAIASKAHQMGLKKTYRHLQQMGKQNVSVRYRDS